MPVWAGPGLTMAVVAAHLGGAWALLQLQPVREAVAQVMPLMVDFVDAPGRPEPEPPVPPPRPRAVPHPTPAPTPTPAPPVIATEPAAEPAPAPMAVPPPPVQAAPAPAEAPAPAAPQPPAVRSIPASAVGYLDPPAPVYPLASRRLGEQGEVLLKVEIGADGRARQVLVARSSGSPRLDGAALAAVRAARFNPYAENGVPLVVWTTVPIRFELENKP